MEFVNFSHHGAFLTEHRNLDAAMSLGAKGHELPSLFRLTTFGICEEAEERGVGSQLSHTQEPKKPVSEGASRG